MGRLRTMIMLRGRRYRIWRWASDDYGDARPVRWMKRQVAAAVLRESAAREADVLRRAGLAGF
jgi:hypothetical protein